MLRFRVAVVALALALALLAAVASADPATNTRADAAPAPGVAGAPQTVSGLRPATGGLVELLDVIEGSVQASDVNTWSLTDTHLTGRWMRQPFVLSKESTVKFVEAFLTRIQFIGVAERIRVEIYSSNQPCAYTSVSGDAFSLVLPVDDARVTITPSASNAAYFLYTIDLTGSNLVLPAGSYQLAVVPTFCDGCSSMGIVMGAPASGSPGFNGHAVYDDKFASVCTARSNSALLRMLGTQAGVATCAPGVVEFVCAADFAPAFTWCVDGAAYAMQCAPGSGCAAGRYQANPCTLRVDLQHAGVTPPACNGADGYVCDAARPAEYYRCAGAQGGAHEGWMPCAPGTTCKATPAGAVTPFNPCW